VELSPHPISSEVAVHWKALVWRCAAGSRNSMLYLFSLFRQSDHISSVGYSSIRMCGRALSAVSYRLAVDLLYGLQNMRLMYAECCYY